MNRDKSMIRWAVLGMLFGATGPADAAVFEVGEDGSVTRLDAPVAAVRAPVRAVTTVSATSTSRARALRPYVTKAAQRYEVSPALVDAIAYTESRYNQGAMSRAGAGGVMQLMPGTARALGVDRADASANIHGGTAYLRQLLNRYEGNIVCTVAAYNAGPGVVSQARCIPPYRETKAYVAAVLDRLAIAAQ